MLIEVSKATNHQLDFMVAKADEREIDSLLGGAVWCWLKCNLTGSFEVVEIFSPTTDWAQAGPIIEREGISLTQFSNYPQWTAEHPYSICYDGPTPLIAAMRCYVASKLGSTVEIPDELAYQMQNQPTD